MTPEERLSRLCALLIERLVKVEAQSEVILKSQAHFLAKVANVEWQPIFQDLENQVREAAAIRRKIVEQEFERLRQRGNAPES